MVRPFSEDRFDEIENWPDAQLRDWQLEQMRAVVRFAWENIPFYRELWRQAGIRSGELRSFEDLQSFPIVRKDDLVKAGNSWLQSGEGNIGFSTRGTSGEPLVLWSSLADQEPGIRGLMRAFWWMGFRPQMTALLLSPAWHKLAQAEAYAIHRLDGRLAYFWGSMGPEYIPNFLKTLREARPELVSTTTPFLLSCVRQSEETEGSLRDCFRNVRSIVVVGQPLTPHLREFLRLRLGVGDVFEKGGCQEGGIGIDDCPWHTGPHIQEDTAYLEVVDENGKPVPTGTRGELVLTKLAFGSGSVIVRYSTEDIAEVLPGTCPCGRAFRRLKMCGRPESSVIVGGKVITAYDVRLCVDEDPDLVSRNVLLVRDENRRCDQLAVAIEGTETHAEALKSRLCQRLGLPEVSLYWLGSVRVAWTFRQVLDRSLLRLQ